MISELQAIKRLLSLKCAIPSDFKITNCLKVRVTNQPVNRRRFTVRFFLKFSNFSISFLIAYNACAECSLRLVNCTEVAKVTDT